MPYHTYNIEAPPISETTYNECDIVCIQDIRYCLVLKVLAHLDNNIITRKVTLTLQ